MFNPITFIAGSAVALAVGFAGGWQVQAWRQGAQQVKVITHTIRVVQHDAQAAVQVATQVQAGQDHVHYITQTVTKEIHDAVPPDADPALGYGFVRLWNASALGVDPAAPTAGQPDDAPSGLKASDALANAAENFGTGNACLIQLKGWQDWWGSVVANHKP